FSGTTCPLPSLAGRKPRPARDTIRAYRKVRNKPFPTAGHFLNCRKAEWSPQNAAGHCRIPARGFRVRNDAGISEVLRLPDKTVSSAKVSDRSGSLHMTDPVPFMGLLAIDAERMGDLNGFSQHGIHRTVLFHGQVDGAFHFLTVQRPLELKVHLYFFEYRRGILHPFPIQYNPDIIDQLPLLFKDQNHVDGAASTQSHQDQFHGPGSRTGCADVPGTVNVDLHPFGTCTFEVKCVIYSLKFYAHSCCQFYRSG